MNLKVRIWENSSEYNELICEREVDKPRHTHAVAINLLLESVIQCNIFLKNFFCLLNFHEVWWRDLLQVSGHKCHSIF